MIYKNNSIEYTNLKIKVVGKYWIQSISDILISDKYRYALLKGDVLSYYAYGEVGLREYSDIDILLDQKECKLIREELINKNFRINTQNKREGDIFSKLYSNQYPELYNERTACFIDLNFDILWGEYEGKRIDMEDFLSDTVEIEIYGLKIKTLPPIKTLIQICLHHYKDMNSIFLLATRKSIKYNMFMDVYYLLKNNLDTISLDKLYEMSIEYEIVPYMFYVLYYTGQVFEDDILKQYIETFRTAEGEKLLNCYGLCAKEQKEWKCDFKTRLELDNLYDLIKDDLTDKDKAKITINKRIFMGDRDEAN